MQRFALAPFTNSSKFYTLEVMKTVREWTPIEVFIGKVQAILKGWNQAIYLAKLIICEYQIKSNPIKNTGSTARITKCSTILNKTKEHMQK